MFSCCGTVPLASTPADDYELQLLYHCSRFCEAAYLNNDENKMILGPYKIENFYNWERLDNRAISFTTKQLHLQSLNADFRSQNGDPLPVTVVAFRGTSNANELLEDIKSYKTAPLRSAKTEDFIATTVSRLLYDLIDGLIYSPLCAF
jgi:hypothetical protein